MNLVDMTLMAIDNLVRTRLRTFLTLLGVIIGIGALSSMVSLGTGMQKNITDAFLENDLFSSLTVSTKKIDLDKLEGGDMEGIKDILDKPQTVINDSVLEKINSLEGVRYAFPSIIFPAELELGEYSCKAQIRGLPSLSGEYKPFNELLAGSFYASDNENSVVLKWETLRKLGLVPYDGETKITFSKEDSLRGFRIIEADSLIGRKLVTKTRSLDPLSMAMGALSGKEPGEGDAFKESADSFIICGILKRSGGFSNPNIRGEVFLPLEKADSIPKLGFSSVWDLFGDSGDKGHSSLYVRVDDARDTDTIAARIQKMGLNTFSVSDQIKEVKQAFLIIDALFGAIGSVALIIAALGIINTMLMSIMERTKEIGIMKSIGGSEREIRFIFFVEAGMIGLVGAVFGLILGWLVSRVANHILNAQIPSEGLNVDLFWFPWWLLAGATAFSVLISLAAGLYPAARAARIDPVKALRHD